MKIPKKQGNSSNLRAISELAAKSASSASSPSILADGIPDRLFTLQGELNVSAFARKCGIRDSLMRKYFLGSTPGADKLAKIAEANNVSADWLATGKGRGPEEKRDPVERALDAYIFESVLTPVIEAIEEAAADRKLSAKQKSRLMSVCSKVYLAMRPEEQSKGFGKIVLAIFDLMMAGEL